jgi:hypothetical protein
VIFIKKQWDVYKILKINYDDKLKLAQLQSGTKCGNLKYIQLKFINPSYRDPDFEAFFPCDSINGRSIKGVIARTKSNEFYLIKEIRYVKLNERQKRKRLKQQRKIEKQKRKQLKKLQMQHRKPAINFESGVSLVSELIQAGVLTKSTETKQPEHGYSITHGEEEELFLKWPKPPLFLKR